MSSSSNNKFKDNRLMQSQDVLRQVISEAIGLYMAKEPKIGDQWREQDFYAILMHLKHEIAEIERSSSLDRQYHNALDAVGQAAIVAAWLRLNRK
jgi:hypothetical protein